MKCLLVAVIAIALTAAGPAVKVEKVKYAALTDALKAHKGKVVVVDFWADFCVPCKREFPHLVKLHEARGKDGFVAVSVALDDPTDDDARERVIAFLMKQKATFPNYLLDEKSEVWQEKLKIDGPPLVMVFNKKGELVKRFEDKGVDYAAITALVDKLLKE